MGADSDSRPYPTPARRYWWQSTQALVEYLHRNSWSSIRNNRRVRLTWIILLAKCAIFTPLLLTIHNQPISPYMNPYQIPLAAMLGLLAAWPDLHLLWPSATKFGYRMPIGLAAAFGLSIVFLAPTDLIGVFFLACFITMVLRQQAIPQALWNASNYTLSAVAAWWPAHWLLPTATGISLSLWKVAGVCLAYILVWFFLDAGVLALDYLNTGKRIYSFRESVESNSLSLIILVASWIPVILILRLGILAVPGVIAFIMLFVLLHLQSQFLATANHKLPVIRLGVVQGDSAALSAQLQGLLANILAISRITKAVVYWADPDGVHHCVEYPDDTLISESAGKVSVGEMLNHIEKSPPVDMEWLDVIEIQVGKEVVGCLAVATARYQAFRSTIELDLMRVLSSHLSKILTIDYLEHQRLYLSTHDQLTGLLNSSAFYASLHAQIDMQPKGLTVSMLDIDHFKSVNDKYGHQAGDVAIRTVGAHLQALLPSDAVLARLHGDEFAWWHRGVDGAQGLDISIQDKLNNIVVANTTVFTVACSIGTSACDEGSVKAILQAADANMYDNKTKRHRLALESAPIASSPQ